ERGALRRAETQKWLNRLKPFCSNKPNTGAVQFNCILFHSTDPMAQFCIGHIRGSVAHCGTRRGYCPEPCRLSKCQHRTLLITTSPRLSRDAPPRPPPTVPRRSLILGCCTARTRAPHAAS